MRVIASLIIILVWTTSVYGKIYKWVDEKGTVHFSDKPTSGTAEEINVRGTGITVHNAATIQPHPASNAEIPAKAKPQKLKKPAQIKHEITENDYRVTANVGELPGDAISISGRISSGPRCNHLVVTATATNENGMSASIEDHVTKTNSFGSTIFEGASRVSGANEDYGFWKISTIKIRCLDPQDQ